MVSTKTRYVFQLAEGPRATEPLIPEADSRRLWLYFAQAEQAALVSEEQQHHLDCWDKYKDNRILPPPWRGNADIRHYEQIVCGFKRRVLVELDTDFRMTVRRSTWLRQAPRDDQREATAWFRGLDPLTRQELCDSYRAEEEAREREDRWVAGLNHRYARVLRD